MRLAKASEGLSVTVTQHLVGTLLIISYIVDKVVLTFTIGHLRQRKQVTRRQILLPAKCGLLGVIGVVNELGPYRTQHVPVRLRGEESALLPRRQFNYLV